MTQQTTRAALPSPQLVLTCADVYRQMGFVALATYVTIGWLENGRPVCSCREGADCANTGKHPIGLYADIKTPDAGYSQVWTALNTEVARGLSVNLALRTGPMSGIFVVDLDRKEGVDGVAQFERWLASKGLSLADVDSTLIAKSGGGGKHYVFKHPDDIELLPHNSGKLFGAGVDVKTGGQPFHVYPSIHKRGGTYGWTNWVQPTAAPDVIVNTAQKPTTRVPGVDVEYTPALSELKEFASEQARSKDSFKKVAGKNLLEALSGQVIAIEGGGHDAFRDIAFILYRKWPTANTGTLYSFLETAVQARLDAYPGSTATQEDVQRSLSSAKTRVADQAASWVAQIATNQEDKPIASTANLLVFFRHHPAWQGVFGYNLRRNRPVYLRQPPLTRPSPLGDVEMTRDLAEIALWFQHRAKMFGRITERDLLHAIIGVAWDVPFDPLYTAVMSLNGKWDGVPRLESALQRVAGTPESAWVRAVFPLWMKSLVARLISPGCKADTMLILEGAQGFKKSTFFSSILPSTDYFCDSLNHVRHDVESIRLVHSGPAIFEIGELSGMKKQEVEDIKTFLSAFQDSLRPLYEPPRNTLRRCIFVGTTNRDDYLRDETGGRRFWPVKVTRPIDIDIVIAEREQWFAEALAQLNVGGRWWLNGEADLLLAHTEQEERLEEDIWTQPILAWLNLRPQPVQDSNTATGGMTDQMNKIRAGDFVSVNQVAELALKIEMKNARTSEGLRISKILRGLGWRPTRKEDSNKKLIRVWERPS